MADLRRIHGVPIPLIVASQLFDLRGFLDVQRLLSIGELGGQIEEAKAGLEEAQTELAKYESLEGREKAMERAHEAAAHA